jgi:hypothetical protein
MSTLIILKPSISFILEYVSICTSEVNTHRHAESNTTKCKRILTYFWQRQYAKMPALAFNARSARVIDMFLLTFSFLPSIYIKMMHMPFMMIAPRYW